MQFHVPWGLVTTIAGLILVYGVTDYDKLGWILVILGAVFQALSILILLVAASAVRAVARSGDAGSYNTNFGRKRLK